MPFCQNEVPSYVTMSRHVDRGVKMVVSGAGGLVVVKDATTARVIAATPGIAAHSQHAL